MPTENYQIHNIYQYKRKTYKNNQNENYMNSRVDQNDLTDSPRSDRVTIDEAGCSCDLDSDGEIANILSKKRPVIELAQLQLQRVLDETDNLFCDNIDCCRSIYGFLNLCKAAILKHNKCGCIFLSLVIVAFLVGVIIGSATCGATLRHFNSPILTCIDNLFISGPSPIQHSFKGIV
ncbi:uncharacterized protein LOC116766253 [Danaus plexippus]|uniref:uncharacterized protein LOC116766253 n=1 Tax=Danaus plexippus TaxID=13037 RepID=UPI0013C49253|nr:uncharacterized protein LOC116766253 [Danaus plexippus]